MLGEATACQAQSWAQAVPQRRMAAVHTHPTAHAGQDGAVASASSGVCRTGRGQELASPPARAGPRAGRGHESCPQAPLPGLPSAGCAAATTEEQRQRGRGRVYLDDWISCLSGLPSLVKCV